MLIQKNLGGGKARCLLQNYPKSRSRNHQQLVLLKLDGFLTPREAGALRRKCSFERKGINFSKRST